MFLLFFLNYTQISCGNKVDDSRADKEKLPSSLSLGCPDRVSRYCDVQQEQSLALTNNNRRLFEKKRCCFKTIRKRIIKQKANINKILVFHKNSLIGEPL